MTNRDERVRLAALELIAEAENAGSSGQYIVLTTDPQVRQTHPHGELAYGPFPEIEAMTFADKLLAQFTGDMADITVRLVPWAQA